MRRGAALLVFLLLLAGCEQQGADGPAPADLPPEIVALNNAGVGQMGQFDYDAAVATFGQVTQSLPDWLPGQVNLAIAILNRQQPGDEERALALVDGVLAQQPGHPRAHYVAGILQFNAGNIKAAAEHFRAVVDADPADAYPAYFLAQSELQLGRPETALPLMERAIELDPYLRSARYGAFLAHQRLGQRDAAREQLEAYQALERNPRSRLAEIKYTRMGPKAEALAVRSAERAVSGAAAPAPLAEARRELVVAPPLGAPLRAGVLIAEDVQEMAIIDEAGRLTLHDLDGAPVAAPFVGTEGVAAVAWGDFDNDGLADLYVARQGPNALWRRTEDGWEDVTAGTGVSLGDADSVDVLFLDADHDGDLDLFVVNRGGADELLSNNADGTFRPLAQERGLIGDPGGGRVLAFDPDQDRDLDLLVSGDQVHLYRNHLLWSYGVNKLPVAPLASPVTVDLAADGRLEWCGLARETLECRATDGDSWQTVAARQLTIPAAGAELALLDVDADGRWELLVAGMDRWQILATEPFGRELQSGPGRVQAVAYPQPGQGPALLVGGADGAHWLGPQPGHWVTLSFTGQEEPGESMRSNRSGLGTRFVVRAGSSWTAGRYLAFDGAPGNSLQPIAIGLAGEPVAELIEIDWPDGVFQTELGLEAGSGITIAETQRQLASCPVLFGWTGAGYEFLSDVLGVGGIGFAVGPGEYAPPRPFESYLIGDHLKPRNGRFELKLTEPMEEVAYVDQVTLHAYDFPETHDPLIDERMATDGSVPTGEVRVYRQVIEPAVVRNQRGEDQTASVRRRDAVAAEPGPADPRFIGLLTEPHVLTLTFDRSLDNLRGVLLMDGWVEYGYSQTSFAAWQAGRAYQPPTLEAASPDGEWQTVAAHFGYPAGMPRQAAFPLPELPVGTTRLRLRTNQEIYWDRLAIAIPDPAAEVIRHDLPVSEARMEKVGFARRTDAAQRRPTYDWTEREPFWDTRYQRGLYTALGPATDLVTALDGGLAVVGPGDGLSLAFDDSLPPLRPGWRRVFVARFEGWAKDMDLYTLDGATVGPLPGEERRTAAAEQLHLTYNTRFQSGR